VFGCGPADGDSSSPAKLQQSLLPKGVKGTQDGVPVHPQYSREVEGWWEAVSGVRLTVGDGTPDGRGDLLVQRNGAAEIDVREEIILLNLVQLNRSQPRHLCRGRPAQGRTHEGRKGGSGLRTPPGLRSLWPLLGGDGQLTAAQRRPPSVVRQSAGWTAVGTPGAKSVPTSIQPTAG